MLKPRLEKFYDKVVCEDLILLYNFKTISQLSSFDRAILNSTSNQFLLSKFSLLQSFCAWFLETNQKCISTRARKSIALFGIRETNLLGLKVTLRKASFYAFLDKLLIFVLPKQISNRKVLSTNLEGCTEDKAHKTHNKKSFSKKSLPSSFTISSRNSLHFPQTSQLLSFFDSLSGFSLVCSLRISHKSYYPEKDSKKEYTVLNVFEEKVLTEKKYINLKRFTESWSLTNERKKVLLSSFQLPVYVESNREG